MIKNKHVLLNFALIIISFTLFSCQGSAPKHKGKITATQAIITKTAPKRLYGIIVDSLNITKGKVKRNQFLADILLKHGVSYATIDYLAKNTRQIFDVRDMRRRHPYALLSTRDSLHKPLYFAYEITPSTYVVYSLKDSLFAWRGKKPIIQKVQTSKGKIKASLWETLIANNDDPKLAIKLSEVYAWTIDFFELRKGDQYKIIYPKLYIDGKYDGFGELKAADFIHKGENYYAFYFVQNGKGEYFDEKGHSLERTFLKAPLKFRRISSRFSNHRWHPILKIYRPHHGVDYAAAEGTPVHSLGDGVVLKRGYQRNGAGNYIKIKHNSIYTTQYAHLSRFARGIRAGVHVKQGQLIGYVGHTGLATGPHLDFRFFKYGIAINPLKVESPSAKPVARAYRQAFDSLVNHYKPMLDSL